jgi:multiple sugar transport system ATP-binding protein
VASVSFEQATRRYQGTTRPAVDHLELTAGEGEFLVLVGPSGCGKSTALRMVAGLEPLDSGRILIGERDVTDADPKDRDIAMVFQNYALYPHMTVAQNLAFALKVGRIPTATIATGCVMRLGCSTSSAIWTANPRICPVDNGSGWRWAARSFAVPRSS